LHPVAQAFCIDDLGVEDEIREYLHSKLPILKNRPHPEGIDPVADGASNDADEHGSELVIHVCDCAAMVSCVASAPCSRDLTFEVTGGRQQAKPDVGRPVD